MDTLTLCGLALLVAGTLLALRLGRPRAAGPSGWFPDPTGPANPQAPPRQRRWDGRAWTGATRPAEEPGPAARPFHGRFAGPWLWFPVTSAGVMVAGSAAYLSSALPKSASTWALVVSGGLAVALSGVGFHGFVDRQLRLRDAIALGPVLATGLAAGGAAVSLTVWAHSWTYRWLGVAGMVAFVGPVEELCKLLVPVALWAAGRYRDPRAGIALGLGAGTGFAVAETARYGWFLPRGGYLDACTGVAAAPLAPGPVVTSQAVRLLLAAPLHWLFTGLAAALLWRLWHRAGPAADRGRTAGPVAAVLLLVAGGHSLYDGLMIGSCGAPPAVGLLRLVLIPLLGFGLYRLFKAAARASLPPIQVGVVSLGWHPQRLRAGPPAGDGVAPPPAPQPDDGIEHPPADPA